ncbi:hypothetical protein [Microcoleus vaginatus]|uniref:hypothetical protein n=1 Tax=Microcoleus vaginatus TaxID=119532 RepID=UPI001F6153DB
MRSTCIDQKLVPPPDICVSLDRLFSISKEVGTNQYRMGRVGKLPSLLAYIIDALTGP